jgi:hypothetical protein
MEKGINKVIISAHGLNTADNNIRHMLGQLRDEGVIVIDENPVIERPNPFARHQYQLLITRQYIISEQRALARQKS